MSKNDSRQPRVAMVGCGYWGKNLTRNFASLGALAAVCDPNDQLAQKMSNEYDVPAVDWDAILGDDSIDAVALATPAEMHARMAQDALESGKHVFVEKPVALRLEDAEELVALSDQQGRTLMVGHLLQYHPAFMKLRKMVGAGDIGRLQYVYSTRLNFGKIRREEDILWSFAPHDISMILALMGDEPNSVKATGSRFLHGEICDTTITHLDFSGGQSAHIFVSWLHPFKEQRLVVIGDRGMLVFDDSLAWDQKLLCYAHKIEWINGVPEPRRAEGVPVELQEEEPLRSECAHFLHCATTGETPRTDGREGLRVLRVLNQASAALGSKLGQP